ncbi:hypothetical protein ACRE_049940 [Hapsidospora chrysogenum ATCC 11550]|uniref:Uncharacterized protein n=1 Tax=Hapsidospora chrysogenum (strain ATCC 11550 / CBS 779.69 / DSM 880 / IAM 14645 / JCM 23072 / IMI 49137) TaxID=857340 RepID=A0A086T4D0_HAPC1|nr:hypothetical protein ACRE_049940 [Hapsidospora chrysogenum ATCC 11550]
MANWRELGEVPDSEDEDGLDSQSTAPLPQAEPPVETSADDPETNGKDIWDVPSSQDDQLPALPTKTSTKVPNEIDENVWDIPSSPEIQPTSTRQPPGLTLPSSPPFTQPDPTSSPLSSIHSSQVLSFVGDFADDETEAQPSGPLARPIFGSPIPNDRIAKSIDRGSSPSRSSRPHVTTPAPPRPRPAETETPLQSQILGHDAEEQARRVAVRYERSLRARRPEQLRPYFIEMARSNRLFRNHGLRPVRFVNHGNQGRRQRDESTERDFEPESQESQPQDPTDESESLESNMVTDGLVLPDLSSSPLRTSPLDNRGGHSSQAGSQIDTDNTSVDGDELPSIRELANSRLKHFGAEPKSKQNLSPSTTSNRKRKRLASLVNSNKPKSRPTFIRLPDSPDPLLSPQVTHDEVRNETLPERNTPARAVNHASEATATPRPLVSTAPPLFDIDSDSSEEAAQVQRDAPEDGATESGSDSDSGAEMLNRNGRRIRGVLPASWLRLDQLSSRNNIQKKFSRDWGQSPERENKRGVAQRRRAAPASVQDRLLLEDSEEEPLPVQQTTDEKFHNQTRLVVEPTAETQPFEILTSDDGASVIEEDCIDPMLPGRKRPAQGVAGPRVTPKRQKTAALTRTLSTKPTRQPRITAAFSNVSASRLNAAATSRKRVKSTQTGARSDYGKRPRAKIDKSRPSPPQLSILDVIEPDAPQFLKVAARTARSRQSQGRTQPNMKSIQLATRADHIDAVSVLKDWANGAIKQRASVTAAKKSRQPRRQTQPLDERSANEPRRRARERQATSGGAPRKFMKHLSGGGHATYQAPEPIEGGTSEQRPRRNDGRSAALPYTRPAQLEIDDGREISAASFHAGKKLLDRLYRARRGVSTVAGSVLSGHQSAVLESVQRVPEELQQEIRPGVQPSATKTRSRRKPKPKRIDLDAPQYSHANDPLPAEYSPSPNTLPGPHGTEGAKLLGLGPYGTSYTHHFEIFPLPAGVYFHDSTLLGSGVVERAMKEDYSQRLHDSRPRVSLTLGEQTLRWGIWNAQVSSEIGVVLDYMAEQLENGPAGDEVPDSTTAVVSANHILSYVKDSVTFGVDTGAKLFVARIVEVVQAFNNRILSRLGAWDFNRYAGGVLGVYDRLLLTAFLSLRISQNDPTMMGEQFQMEDLLKTVASTLVKILSHVGLGQVRTVYGDLNNIRLRERGLREDVPAVHSWTLVLRILEAAKIPRSSFWDVVQGVLAPPNLLASVDSREHEKVWEDMFTLLPLVEFNDIGVAVQGQRYDASTDGWGLPQKILKRVFQLYRENTRQGHSFNDYCRALVGRCHYLVQQWGWRRCSSVVGVIFDFFGSQNLAHLRNEACFTSPRFLENLAREPSLDIEPEDRCFHVFLKLLALGIRKLRDDGSTKDIRNLVARTVPNHNRQYLKEQNIHERDLAALRNHHDLLCTLYWAAPPDLRPNVGLIERLIVPASSHKEACLINLRAWNQLARFIVATGEAPTSFRPLNMWRNNFFLQMMHQYDSVASDIEQQFMGLSNDISNSVSRDMISAMTVANKAAVMDVLHLSATVSLDAMRHAPDLEAATFALSTLQLQKVFKHFSVAPPELDWAILRASLATLDVFLSRVDQFKDDEESQQSESQILNSAQADDALLVLNHDLAAIFFKMARCVLSPRSRRDANVTAALEKATCIEQVVVLAARMGMRFINAGVMSLPDMFKPGEHCLFGAVPHKLGLDERRYLTLFVATLLKHGFDDFSEPGFTQGELWMLAIVKPRESLAFENNLAEELIRQGKEFVPEAVAGLTVSLDYDTNRDLFEFAISSMRKSIQDAGPNMKKILLSEHKRSIQLVMDQIKGDLKTVSQDPNEHPSYLHFARDIISLIRAHGSDFCTVDEFFYRISKEYSPSLQDPQLQVAGMVSYGLRLSEGDTGVAHQLFFFLINNFKLAMMNDKTFGEVQLLSHGLGNPGILSFVLGKMLPAIIRAATVETASFPLVDVYTQACHLWLDDDEAPPELSEGDLPHLRRTLKAIVDGIGGLSGRLGQTAMEIHLVRQYLGLMNVFWPSLYVLALSDVSSHDFDAIKSLLKDCSNFTKRNESYLLTLIDFPGFDGSQTDLLSLQLLDTGEMYTDDPHVAGFTQNIVDDVRTNWILSGDRLSIQAPGKPRSTQSGQGMHRPTFDRRELFIDVYERTRIWNQWWDKAFGSSKATGRASAISAAAPVF